MNAHPVPNVATPSTRRAIAGSDRSRRRRPVPSGRHLRLLISMSASRHMTRTFARFRCSKARADRFAINWDRDTIIAPLIRASLQNLITFRQDCNVLQQSSSRSDAPRVSNGAKEFRPRLGGAGSPGSAGLRPGIPALRGLRRPYDLGFSDESCFRNGAIRGNAQHRGGHLGQTASSCDRARRFRAEAGAG